MEIPAGVTVIPEAEIVAVDGDAGLLGRGALGEVRRGRWVAVGAAETPVALKRLFLLRDDVAALAEMGGALSAQERAAVVEAFLRECATLSSASHPNILPFYGIVVDAARQPMFMATALVPSGSLRDLCQDERYAHFRVQRGEDANVLSYAVVVDVLLDVFLALEYLHTRAQPVIHRDVKPANILIELSAAGQFQKAMLADLGEAKQVVFGTRAAQSLGSVGVGTLLYMAPEMKEAELMKGPKVDIFSCGVAAAEIATGRCPSPGPEMAREGGRRVVVPEEERRREDIQAVADDEFRASVVERCITDDPADRADAAQMVAACRQLQRNPAYVDAQAALAAVMAQRVSEGVPPSRADEAGHVRRVIEQHIFEPTGNIGEWIVPDGVTAAKIEAQGAQGSCLMGGVLCGGHGANVSGRFILAAGQVLKILVGVQPDPCSDPSGAHLRAGGGGGGTFVVRGADEPLLVAGGGGGACKIGPNRGLPASVDTAGVIGSVSGFAGFTPHSAGEAGRGGQADGHPADGCSGRGFLGDGQTHASAGHWRAGTAGVSFLAGGMGGTARTNGGPGGFGGGGAGGGDGGGGGGGGYSGGGGNNCGGGGGGSFNAGTEQTAAICESGGSGKVTITLLNDDGGD